MTEPGDITPGGITYTDARPRKIALLGTAPSSVHAPFNDPTWEIWGVGLRGSHVTRADKWFELHRLDGEPPEWAAEWRRLMKAWSDGPVEILMFWPEPDLGRNVRRYPLDEITAKFGTFFMTSSFAWMIALAITEKPAEIGFWGVDMEYGAEYREQRAGLQHFKSLAKHLGIKITQLVSSGIAYQPVPYPFWQDDPQLSKVKLRRAAFEDKQREQERILDGAQGGLARTTGQIEELRRLPESGEIKARIVLLERAADGFSRTVSVARDNLAQIKGALAELAWHEDYLKP